MGEGAGSGEEGFGGKGGLGFGRNGGIIMAIPGLLSAFLFLRL